MRALLFALLFALAAPAAAQTPGTLANPSTGGPSPLDTWSMGEGTDWRMCANVNHDRSFDLAIEACTRIIGSRGGRAVTGAALWYRARLYEDQHDGAKARADWDAAIALYTEVIQADPREAYGYTNRAATLVRIQEYDRALADYARAIELDRHLAHPHAGRGRVFFRRGDFQAAIEEFDEAYHRAALAQAIDPSHHAARCIARAAARVDLEQARSLCDRAVRNSRAAAPMLAARGYFRFMQGDLEGADADFRRGVERDEWDAQALYGRGVVAVRLGRQAEGEADMARARELDRFDVEYYANAGLTP